MKGKYIYLIYIYIKNENDSRNAGKREEKLYKIFRNKTLIMRPIYSLIFYTQNNY